MSRKHNGGFTLVELVVVISIIAIMSTLSVSLISGTSSLRAKNADKMALVEMNNVFMAAYGADTFAYPQTATDIKLVLEQNGYEWSEPKQKGAEYYFDTSNGRMCLAKYTESGIVFDSGITVEPEPNDVLIAADGFLKGYVYMGTKYRSYLDEFNSIEVDGDEAEAAASLTQLLSNEEMPLYLRKSLRTLAEHSIFVGSQKALTFTGITASAEPEDDNWFEFAPVSGTASDDYTIAVFTEKDIKIEEQLKNCYIKSLYVPSDVTLEFAEAALDDSWIQRILVNTDEALSSLENTLQNKNSQYDLTLDVAVLKKYYPSELPAYDLATASINDYIKLYNDMKEASHDFADFYANELVAKPQIDKLYNGFYKLRRPSDRRFVTKAIPELYDNITKLHSNAVELKTLYDAVKKYDGVDELMVHGLAISPENYHIADILDDFKTKDGITAYDRYNKLFTGYETDNVVLRPILGQESFIANQKGEGTLTLHGILGDNIECKFRVCGAFDSIDISGVDLNSSGHIVDVSESRELFGTMDSSGSGVIVSPKASGSGEFVHSQEKLVITPVDTTKASATGMNVKVTALNNDLTLKVRVSSLLNPEVTKECEVSLKGNTCNVFTANEFESVNKNSHGMAFHCDVTSSSQSTWTVPQGLTVYGNGYTFTNRAKTPEDAAWAQLKGEFRFPAVVTVKGTIKNLKIVVRTSGELDIENRFESIAEAESGDTRSTIGVGGLIAHIKGNISNNVWKSNDKKITIELLSKRLAAVRVYGTGLLERCIVEGGQYGVHLIGSTTDTGKYNLNDVRIKESFTAHIYITDNDGAAQNFAINEVHTYNEFIAEAFPIYIEPKAIVVSTAKYDLDRVYGYGLSIKYRYDLLDNNINLKCTSLKVYNTISDDAYYNMIYDSSYHNMEKINDNINDSIRFLDTEYGGSLGVVRDIVNDFGFGDSFNVPITYGEQKYLQLGDRTCTFTQGNGNNAGKLSERSGFANFIKGYNTAKRGVHKDNAKGTDETYVSFYAVPTNSGGAWAEPDIRP